MVSSDQIIEDRKYEKKWLILAAVMLGNIMGPLDGSIVNTVLPEITRYFNSDISIAQWVPTIYLLTISCLILLYGRLGDMIGHKKIFLTGLAAFTVTSALCGISQNIWMLIVFRAFQGLAAGMMMAVSFAIITSTFPPKERGKALGIGAMGIAIGLSLGPTLGGLIAEHGWRYIFFVNIPIGITSLLWGLRVIPIGDRKPDQRLDYAGAIVAFIFLLSILLYANRGEDWGWLSTGSNFLLIVAIISGVSFVVVEKKSKQPMLNLSLFNSRRFSIASISALLCFIALYALIFLTPFYMIFVLKYSIVKVGLVIAVSPLFQMIVAPVSGALSDRLGTRGFAFSGMALTALGLWLLSDLNISADWVDIVWRLIVVGIGMGMFQSPNNSAVMGSVPPWHIGIASGILAAMRNIGMVFGLAIAGAVLYNVAPVVVSKPPALFNAMDIEEFLSGLHWAYMVGMIIAGISAVTSIFAVDKSSGKAAIS